MSLRSWGWFCFFCLCITGASTVFSSAGRQNSGPVSYTHLPLPPLTEERRRELTKVVKGMGEDAKVAVRNLRRDANTHVDRLCKDKEISEDDQRRAETEIQKITDRFIGEVDKVVAEKDKEIMTV